MRLVFRTLALTLAFAIPAAAQTSAVPIQTTPLDPANLDRSVSACTDFYQFANGGWVKRNPIPPAFSRWGSFDQLSETNNSNLLTILRSAAASGNSQASEDLRKLGVYYSSCMDSVGAERAGTQPITPALARIAAIRNRGQLEAEVARLHSQGVPVLFGFGAGQDAKNSTSVIAGINQGGLSLPDRDYYLNTDKRYVDIRANYTDHVSRVSRVQSRWLRPFARPPPRRLHSRRGAGTSGKRGRCSWRGCRRTASRCSDSSRDPGARVRPGLCRR